MAEFPIRGTRDGNGTRRDSSEEGFRENTPGGVPPHRREGSAGETGGRGKIRRGGRRGGGGGSRKSGGVRLWLFRGLLLAIAAGLFLVAIAWIWVRIPDSGSRQQVLYYTAPTLLARGVRIDTDEFEERLRRLGYHAESDSLEPGDYRVLRRGFEVQLRPFRYPEGMFDGALVRVSLDDGEISSVETTGSADTDTLRLEPERIAGFDDETGSVLDPLELEDAPEMLVETLVLVEDRRFYRHLGIDPIGIARALRSNMRESGEPVQGGSTLTQQLARSLYLHNQKTLIRKIQEALLAVGLELKYSKREILEGYLNAVYWGHWGTLEIRGAREACRYYLGKELDKADAAGIALLVGLIQAPNAYSPYQNQDRALERRNLVLRLMYEHEILTKEQMDKAVAQPVPSKRPPRRIGEASYFLDAVRREVRDRASDEWLTRPGTRIFTTLDYRDQAAAVSAVAKGLEELEKDYRRLRREKDPLQAAAVVLDPATGEVRALVGGRDYLRGPFNRATAAKRQPGSLFKPIVYLTAFSHRERGRAWTPATLVDDSPLEVKMGRQRWRPQNYDKEYRGEVTIRRALEQSLNVPTARVSQSVGVEAVASTAERLGIQSPLDPVPSLALGTSEVTLLEVSSAYATLANRGHPRTPTFLRGILRSDGRSVDLSARSAPEGVDEAPAFLTTRMLQGVIDHGTGRAARSLGVQGAVAGKTGTTDDFKDAWFVGYSTKRVAGVWVGFDQKDAVGLSGAKAALPIWARIMKEIQPPGGDPRFQRPKGVTTVSIDPVSGQLATERCPDAFQEDFLGGTEPREECDLHRENFWDRLERIFGF